MSRSGRMAIPIAGLPGLDIRASTQITAGATTNHVGAIGVKRRSDAGRNRDVSGPARAVCVSMNPKDELVLDSIAAHHGVTRSGALRAALMYYAAAMKIAIVLLLAFAGCDDSSSPVPMLDASHPTQCGANPTQDATCTHGASDYACADGTNPALTIPGLACTFEVSDLSYCCQVSP